MIRLVFFSIVAFSFFEFTLSNAQTINKAPEIQKFSIGVKAGPSVTYIRYPDKDLRNLMKARPKFGYGGSFFINFPLSRTSYTFLAEAGYSVKGRRYLIDGVDSLYNNQTYQFAEMAMALRKSFDWHIAPNVPSKWFFNVGPNIAYWVNGHGKFGKGKFGSTKYDIKFNETPDGDLYTNYLNNINRWLFGIDLGIGAEAAINNRQRVRLELRGTFGQTYLGKKNGSSSYASLSWVDSLKGNLKTLSITAAYTLEYDMRAMKMGKSTNKVTKSKKR